MMWKELHGSRIYDVVLTVVKKNVVEYFMYKCLNVFVIEWKEAEKKRSTTQVEEFFELRSKNGTMKSIFPFVGWPLFRIVHLEME